jgi:F5/8 type C domain-containing protein
MRTKMENDNQQTPHIESPIITSDMKTSRLRGSGWRTPYIMIFVLIFAVIGGYILVNSFAATVSLTKVWSTASDWNSGTLSNAAVTGNSVELAPSTSTPVYHALSNAPSITAVPTDLALDRPASASSSVTTRHGFSYFFSHFFKSSSQAYPASNAVDGSTATRWASQSGGNQWLSVDLGATYNIGEVNLSWYNNYGKSYQIQTSTNGSVWTTIYSTTSGTGGTNDLTGLKGSGRYVRIYITSGNSSSYSIWEMYVYGATQTVTPLPNPTSPITTYPSSGTLLLNFNAGSSVGWTSLTPQVTLAGGTGITYQVRTSNDNSTWSSWSSSNSIASLPNSQYLQIEANLTTSNSANTPLLNSLTLGYNATIANPTVTLTASPTSVTSGQASTLSWSSSNTTSCTASGGWSGSEPTSGSAAVTPSQTNTYNISCNGAGGTASSSASVTVSAPSAPSGGGTASNSGPGGSCSAITDWVASSSTFKPLSDIQAASHVCAAVENRPNNTKTNDYVPTSSQLQAFYSSDTNNVNQTVVQFNPYYQDVTGNYTGTTDELIQWASWKWGIPTDWLRAEYALESNWNQSETNSAGQALEGFGFGDEATVSASDYSKYPAVAQQGNNEVYQSMGITQVKWTPEGSVGAGTEPLRWESTAFNIDYQAATIRFYFDNPSGDRSSWGDSSYQAGQEWNSLGGWFEPYPWANSGQEQYISEVQCRLNSQIWTQPTVQTSSGGSEFENTSNC